jgi:hypothetical protein
MSFLLARSEENQTSMSGMMLEQGLEPVFNVLLLARSEENQTSMSGILLEQGLEPAVVVGEPLNTQEHPLQFDDIVDRRTYDKMRPPKPGGRETVFPANNGKFHEIIWELFS